MTTRLLFAGFWALAILWLINHDTDARDQSATTVGAKSDPFPSKVLGRGLTQALARRNALERAREEIIAYMQKQDPPLTAWQPSADYIDEHWVVKEEPGEDEPLVDDKKTKTYYITLKEVEWSKLREMDRKECLRLKEEARLKRSSERSVSLAKVVVGAIMFLAVLFGLVKLDERTQRRYSGVLYVSGLIAVVAAVSYVLMKFPF